MCPHLADESISLLWSRIFFSAPPRRVQLGHLPSWNPAENWDDMERLQRFFFVLGVFHTSKWLVTSSKWWAKW